MPTENSTWDANNSRVSFFYNTLLRIDPSTLWPEDESIVMEKQTSNPQTGEVLLEGKFEDINIAIVFLSIRIDIVLSKPIQPSLQEVSIPNIGTMEDSNELISRFLELWISRLPKDNIYRIAFGVELFRSVTDATDGYRQVSRYIPFALDRSKYSDFLLQLNSPTQSEIKPELKINRLTIWDVPKISLHVNTSSQAISYSADPVYYCHLNLDINTDQNFSDTIEEGHLLPIVKELINLGKEVSENGIVASSE